MSSRSAIAEAPVEIWIEIIHQVLENSVLFRADPFYPGCNLHSALAKWYDWTHVKNYKTQRCILRLVSRSWKGLVDSQFGWFLEHLSMRVAFGVALSEKSLVDTQSATEINAMWKCARRIHIDSSPPKCNFEDDIQFHPICICDWSRYNAVYHGISNPYNSSVDFTDIIQWLSQDGPLSAEILIFGPDIWAMICDFFPQATLGHLFSNVRTLDIAYGRPGTHGRSGMIKTPNFLANLVYLNIWGWYTFETQRAHFPNLTSLRIILIDENIKTIYGWNLPKLQYLDINADRITRANLLKLVKKGWPHLISFKCEMFKADIWFEQGIWDALPRLEHLSCSFHIHLSHNVIVQPDFPLHTISFLAVPPGWSKDKEKSILQLIPHLPNLRTIAEYHSWDDVRFFPPPSDTASDDSNPEITPEMKWVDIVKMDFFCASRHLRYEDRWGRSLEEFNRRHSI